MLGGMIPTNESCLVEEDKKKRHEILQGELGLHPRTTQFY